MPSTYLEKKRSPNYKSNQARYTRTRKHRTRVQLDKLKNAPCSDCKNIFPPECMDFDHVIGIKNFDIGDGWSNSWGIILAEIAKCELVCANCHRIRTRKRKHSL